MVHYGTLWYSMVHCGTLWYSGTLCYINFIFDLEVLDLNYLWHLVLGKYFVSIYDIFLSRCNSLACCCIKGLHQSYQVSLTPLWHKYLSFLLVKILGSSYHQVHVRMASDFQSWFWGVPPNQMSIILPNLWSYFSFLLQAGSDPNGPDVDEWTPLHAAAHWGQEEACKLLADYGADFTLRNHVVCFELPYRGSFRRS